MVWAKAAGRLANRVAWRTRVAPHRPAAFARTESHAAPGVWGDGIFIVAADPETEERMLICLERQSGKIVWKQTVLKSPVERKHRENSYASSTPATDGQRVYCTFLDGPEVVIAAYDF